MAKKIVKKTKVKFASLLIVLLVILGLFFGVYFSLKIKTNYKIMESKS